MFSPALVCVCVCLSVITTTKKLWTDLHLIYANVPRPKGKTRFVFCYDW